MSCPRFRGLARSAAEEMTCSDQLWRPRPWRKRDSWVLDVHPIGFGPPRAPRTDLPGDHAR